MTPSLQSPFAKIGFGVLAVYLGLAALYPVIEDRFVIRLDQRLKSFSADHWFGTDQFGRDTFAMIIGGCYSSLTVALMAVALGACIGIPLGLVAAARTDLLSRSILSLNDFIFAFPALVTAILLHTLWGSGLFTAGLAIGVFNIPVFARTIYGAARPLWTKDFIKAARLAGRNDLTIALIHILPLVTTIACAQLSMQIGLGILAEAGLSYVGLGVTPPMPSWGRMLNEAQTLIAVAPRLAILPGLALACTVFLFTELGDYLIERADPKRDGAQRNDHA